MTLERVIDRVTDNLVSFAVLGGIGYFLYKRYAPQGAGQAASDLVRMDYDAAKQAAKGLPGAAADWVRGRNDKTYVRRDAAHAMSEAYRLSPSARAAALAALKKAGY